MKFNYCLVLSLLGIASGSPYYYREDKHHSEHHKEYSYNNGQPSSLNTYEPSPERYYESSHFSSHVTPERYYKVETSPSFSSGFGQYSGGQSSYYQSGFKSSGVQNGHLFPLATGQTLNVEGMKPGTYVVKQIKVYGQPTVHTSSFYSPSVHSSQLEGRRIETGQREERFYAGQEEEDLGQKEMSSFEGQHEESLDGRSGEYIKHVQTNSQYHEGPSTITHNEGIYGQKNINVEDFQTGSHFGQQIEGMSGQKEESMYTERQEDFGQQQERGDLIIGQTPENPKTKNSYLVKTVQISPINNGQGYKYYEKKVTTFGIPVQNSSTYKQVYVRNEPIQTPISELRKNEESIIVPKTNKSPTNYENVQSESRQQTEHIRYSQGTVELGKKLTTPASQSHYSNPGYPVIIPISKETKVLSYQDREAPKSLFGQQTERKSHTGFLEIEKEDGNLHGQHSEDLGQQLMTGSSEIGQQLENDGQKLETGSFEVVGQKEEHMDGPFHTWQKQVNTSRVEISGHRREPELGNLRKPGNVGQLSIGSLEIGQEQVSYDHPHFLVKQEGQRGDNINGQNLETGFLELGQKEENVGQLETGNLEAGQHEETLEIGQQSENFGQQPEKGDFLVGQKEESLHFQVSENDRLELGQREKSIFDINQSKAVPLQTPTKKPSQNEITSHHKTYNHHQSYYNELTQKEIPIEDQKYRFTTTPRIAKLESINKNHRKNYFEMQRKAEELADQLGLEDSTKEKSSQQERDIFEGILQNNKRESTTSTTTDAYKAEIQEFGLENQRSLEEASKVPNKQISWETHKEEYGIDHPQPSRTVYSKKHSKQYYQESQSYTNQPKPQDYAYPAESQRSSQYGGYQHGYSLNNGERTYINDQPIQRSQVSGSQFSFSSSSSGSSQDKHKTIDDFLKELDKDIARNGHQQQGSYATRSGSGGMTYYSQKTVSSHSNSSYTSGGTMGGGDSEKSWYRRIGDSLGSSYNQAKDKAKEIAETVKHSVGYSR